MEQDANQCGTYRGIQEGCFGDELQFELHDKWDVVHWLAIYRPKPEDPGKMSDRFVIECPDGKTLTGAAIDQWIYDLVHVPRSV